MSFISPGGRYGQDRYEGVAAIFRLVGSLISGSCQAYSWRRFALATLLHSCVSIDTATRRWIHARGLEEVMDGPDLIRCHRKMSIALFGLIKVF